MSYANRVSIAPIPERPINRVYVEGLVILKIIKHCQEEGPLSEVQGTLLGLIRDGELEVTNCFPLPRRSEDDEDDHHDYQHVMMRHLRNVNVDHLNVGWYQSSPYGGSASKLETVDSQYVYQSTIEESIVLLYDPIRTQRGHLSIKVYRLTNQALKLCKEGEFTIETLKNHRMSSDKFIEEIPVTIRNSNLITGLMCELDAELPADEGKQFLDMGAVNVMEKSLQSLMKCVEDVSKYANYQKQIAVKQQQIAKENAGRAMRGEPPLTEDEVNKIIKPLTAIQRLETVLNSCQTLNFCLQASSYSSQNIGKLFLSKALQEKLSK